MSLRLNPSSGAYSAAALAALQVRPTFQRWLEDALADKFYTLDDLPALLKTSRHKASRLLNESDPWSAADVLNLAEALQVHWYDDLVERWGLARNTLTIDACNQIAREREEGWYLTKSS